MEEARTNWVRGAIVLVVVLLAAIAVYGLLWGSKPPPPPPPAPPVATVPAPPAPAPVIQHPVPEADTLADLRLDDSDAAFLEAIERASGTHGLLALVKPTRVIRHIVATVDALPRAKVALDVLPTKPVPGRFLVESGAAGDAIAAANDLRYRAYVQFLQALDMAQAVKVYHHFYPLFQQAYRELGYPTGYFNDRLIEAIDDMLDAPELTPPVRVEAPHAMYIYSNADLESASAGQKVLMRMGRANEQVVKAKLRLLRHALAG